MSAPIQLIPGAISEMFAQVSTSGVITLSDRYGLMAAMYDESLSDEERQAIDRILRLACRKQLTFLNETPVEKEVEKDKA
jgi:hypothetical protein